MASGRLNTQSRAEVYSKVLFDSAKTEGADAGVINARNELLSVYDAISLNMRAKVALESEDVSVESKLKIAKTVCASCSVAVKTVFECIVKNDDVDLIKLILRKMEDLISLELGLCVVDVVSAVEIDDSIRDLIKKKAKDDLGLDATLNEIVDKSILGGVILSVNGKCIDASMNTQLNRARAVLKAS